MIELIEILLGAVRHFVINDDYFDICSAVISSSTVIIMLITVVCFCMSLVKYTFYLFKR